MLAVEIINEHYLANIDNRDSEPGHYTDSPLCIVLSFLSGSRIMCYDQRRFATTQHEIAAPVLEIHGCDYCQRTSRINLSDVDLLLA